LMNTTLIDFIIIFLEKLKVDPFCLLYPFVFK
jgi:hypothetical protein